MADVDFGGNQQVGFYLKTTAAQMTELTETETEGKKVFCKVTYG